MASDNTWFRTHNIAVGQAPVLAARPSAGRRALVIFNSGQTTIHVHTTETVSSANGISIKPDGSVNLTEIWDFASVRQGWYALSDAAGGRLTVYEAVESAQGGGAQ